jgi:hypothetical protein
MRPFESPDDALPAPLPEGGATEISGSITPAKRRIGRISKARPCRVYSSLAYPNVDAFTSEVLSCIEAHNRLNAGLAVMHYRYALSDSFDFC